MTLESGSSVVRQEGKPFCDGTHAAWFFAGQAPQIPRRRWFRAEAVPELTLEELKADFH